MGARGFVGFAHLSMCVRARAHDLGLAAYILFQSVVDPVGLRSFQDEGHEPIETDAGESAGRDLYEVVASGHV